MMRPDDYLAQCLALLPRGLAWTQQLGSNLSWLLQAWSDEFSRVDDRCNDLVNEADPRTAYELLPDWERVAGLPDPCAIGTNTTLQERRMALVSKLTSIVDQSRASYIALAETMGYSIQIVEYQPFMCGLSQCGVSQLMSLGALIRHYWTVVILGPRVTYFRLGESECGIDPIVKLSVAADLECRFRSLNQAHRVLNFLYEG